MSAAEISQSCFVCVYQNSSFPGLIKLCSALKFLCENVLLIKNSLGTVVLLFLSRLFTSHTIFLTEKKKKCFRKLNIFINQMGNK